MSDGEAAEGIERCAHTTRDDEPARFSDQICFIPARVDFRYPTTVARSGIDEADQDFHRIVYAIADWPPARRLTNLLHWRNGRGRPLRARRTVPFGAMI
jgi:hypothetical protein